MTLNKKFFLSLLALTALTACACDDDNDDSCTDNATKACKDANTSVICINGEWKDVVCSANQTCSAPTNRCTPTSGTGDNGGSGNITVDPSIPAAGTACTYKTSEAKCASDKSYGVICGSSNEYYNYTCKDNDCFVCEDGFLTCGSSNCKGGSGGNSTLEACTADSTEKCSGACSTDKKTGYYWNNGIKTVDCSAKSDCSVSEKGFVQCGSGSGNSGSGDITVDPSIPAAGTACTYKTSEAKCASDKSYGVICGKSNEYYNYTCKDNDCFVCEDGFLTCGSSNCKSSGGTTQESCTATSTAKCTAACSTDKKTGYYWSSKNGIQTLDCSEKSDCAISDSGRVSCGVPEACEVNYKGTCSDDKATARVCYNNVMVDWECYNNGCSVDDTGTVTCPRDPSTLSQDCTGDKVNRATSGGKDGDCCDPDKYVPAGCVDNAGLRCDSEGVLKDWKCTDPKLPVCYYEAEKKWYDCKAE